MPPSRRNSRAVRVVMSSPHRFEGTEPAPTCFNECREDQFMLLPVDMRDWLPQGQLANSVRDMVQEIDLTPFCWPYAGECRRNRPYLTRMMVKVLICTYTTGVHLPRRTARKPHDDVAFRMICNSPFLHHRTICEFRRRHLGDFRHLFVEVARLAREAEFVRLGTVTVDGTKMRANASKRRAMSHRRMLTAESREADRKGKGDSALGEVLVVGAAYARRFFAPQ